MKLNLFKKILKRFPRDNEIVDVPEDELPLVIFPTMGYCDEDEDDATLDDEMFALFKN